ncbi:MAG: Flp family type IVb pilin [Peptococcia bacterium]
MAALLKRLVREEKGQGMAEYGLILALVAVAVIAALVVLGPTIAEKIRGVSDSIENPPDPPAEGAGS